MNLTETATNNSHECILWCKERSIATAALGTTAIAVAILGATIAVLAATGNLEGVIQFAANAWQMPAVRIALFAGAGFVAAVLVTIVAYMVYKPQKTLDMSKVNLNDDPEELNDLDEQQNPDPVVARTPSDASKEPQASPNAGRPSPNLSPGNTKVSDQTESPISKENMTIHDAASQGNTVAIEKKLIDGMSLSVRNKQMMTPLHLAAAGDQEETVEFLLSQRANTNLGDERGNTPLHCAAQGNAPKAIESLVKQNSTLLSAKNNQGESPIHVAARCENIDALKKLWEVGADIEAIDAEQKTPLHTAAKSGRLLAVEGLLNMGANKMALETNKKIPADLARMWIENPEVKNAVLEALKKT